jgi:peptidoglycan/xylan/chitin deacetylase (PgdA/CDA1 family)
MWLSDKQIDYIFHHLGHHCQLTEEVRDLFSFEKSDGQMPVAGKIIVKLAPFGNNWVVNRWVCEVFVPFSVSDNPDFYELTDQNLIFHHDLFSCVFYLLSGMQEFNAENLDKYGRFPFEQSLQCKFGFVGKPMVNYYFEILISAVSKFCAQQGINFQAKAIQQNWTLLLSHDVDFVHKYTARNIAFCVKQFFISNSRTFNQKRNDLKESMRWFSKTETLKDPYHTFDYLHDLAKKYGFKTTWFLLGKGKKHDGRYCFTDKQIQKLIQKCSNENHELAIHGTFFSYNNAQRLIREIQNFKIATSYLPKGIRQHFLKYKLPETAKIQQNVGFMYDATLGFSASSGFRNSYTHPFFLYDFEKDETLTILQIPLVAMDVSYLSYLKSSYNEILEDMDCLLSEVRKFNGVFTLLWHNSNLDENEWPGIKLFYEEILHRFAQAKPLAKTCEQLASIYTNPILKTSKV